MKVFETVAALAAATLAFGQMVETKGYTSAGDGGGSKYIITAGASPEAEGSPDLVNAVHAALQYGDIPNVLQYGAVGDGVADDSTAIQAAVTANSRVYFPPPSVRYLVGTTISVGSNKLLVGGGKANTNIQASADGVPTKVLEFNSATKSEIRDLNVTWIGATDTGVSFFESNKCTVDSVGGNALNQDSGTGATFGFFIRMDMGSDANAYTHTIKNCDSQGADIYVFSTGPITGCIFADNKGRSANGFRFSRGSGVAGTAPITGNRISGNLIQAYSAATYGTGVGIDWGVGDAASPDHTFANFIENNYIERWATGILFRDGSVNNSVGANEYDNNTADITDSTATKDAYSEFAGTKKFLKLGEYKAEFRPAGIRFTNFITGDINYDGDKIDKAVSANGTTISVNGRILRLTGDGAARTGTILGIPGDDVDGQRCLLTGLTWSVTFLVTNIDIAAGFTMGNGSGEYSSMEFEWDKTNQKWTPIGSFLRP